MKIFYGYKGLSGQLKDPVVAIGIFDGIHLGHKRVIKKVLSSRLHGSDKVVMTFDPHPQTVLRPGKTPPRLMSLEHRLFILQKMGIDAAVIMKFTGALADMTPEDFVGKVLGGMNARKVFVGSNFHFGRGKSGDAETFRAIGRKYGIEVVTVQPVRQRGKIVSSTWLRQLITAGRIERAEKLLRRPVSILGTVVAGDRRGGAFGFPTANIDPHQEVIPPPGVYAVKIDVDGTLFDGVLNVGFKPTFYGGRLKKRKEPHIEVHIIGFDGQLYGKALEIFFIKRLRRERHFKSVDRLKAQIHKDILKAERFLSSPRVTSRIKRYKYI